MSFDLQNLPSLASDYRKNKDSLRGVLHSSPDLNISSFLLIVGPCKQVMGGGHALSPYLSSTKGVHISTSAFKSIQYDEKSQMVNVGAGLKWDELYVALEQHGVNVPGGRIPGVGVGGFILGGGRRTRAFLYSGKTF